jgi:hypothetical protein
MKSGRSEARNRGRFQKGRSGNPGGKPKNGSAGPPPILRDLRWAYSHSADDKKGTPQQEDFRKLYRENHVKFVDLLTKHEGMNKASEKVAGAKDGSHGGPQPEEAVDEGHERLEALYDELLDGFDEERRKEDAELAKRPDAAQLGASLQHALNASLEREKISKTTVEKLRKRVKELEVAQRNGS